MAKQTKKALQQQLKALNVKYTRKHTIAQLEEMLASATAATTRKQRPSTKAILRSMFANVGDTHSVAHVIAHVQQQHAVQAATIGTMLGDLKNPKYAAGPTINIVRKGDNYVRES
jgi:hypothetical protein